MSAWIQGRPPPPTPASVETASAGMTANGAEIRFWVYFDTTNQYRIARRLPAVAAADRASSVQFANDGHIYVCTDRAGNPNGYTTGAYTPVGTYAIGWTEFRIVYDFASQTYTLSKRASATDPWTPLKAAGATGYAIPFRGANTITATHGTLFRAYQNANLWLDELALADGGIN